MLSTNTLCVFVAFDDSLSYSFQLVTVAMLLLWAKFTHLRAAFYVGTLM